VSGSEQYLMGPTSKNLFFSLPAVATYICGMGGLTNGKLGAIGVKKGPALRSWAGRNTAMCVEN